MPLAVYIPSQIGEGFFTDWQAPASGTTDTGKVWAWNNSTAKYEPVASLSNFTLVTPTIASFANATHDHSNAAGGGTIAHSVLTGLTTGNPHTQYLLATGATTGASSQAQTFTNGIGAGTTVGSGFIVDALGKVRISQSGAGVATAFALSVQSNASTTWIEILNSGGTNKGAFFGMSGDTFQLWNYQGGEMLFYTGLTASTGTPRLRILPDGTNIVQGYSAITGTQSVINGELRLGNTDAYQLRMSYEGASSGKFYIDNRYDNANGDIIIRTRAAGTPVVTTIKGDGKIGLNGLTSPTAWMDVAASTTSAASLRIRSGSAPTSPNDGDLWQDGALTYHGSDATTGSIVNTMRLRRNSSGTPTAGFGSGLHFQMKSSTTAAQDAGRLTFEWGVATHASRESIGKLTAFYTSTEQEAIRWRGGSGGVLLGFYGATSVAKQSVTGSRGGNAALADLLTKLANLGLITDGTSA